MEFLFSFLSPIFADPLHHSLLLLLGIFTGILAGIFGIGGGAIIVPFVIMLGSDIKIAIGISIMQMIFSSFYGSYVNWRKGLLDMRDGVFVGLGGLLGAAFSGALVDAVPSRILEGIFTCFIIYSLLKLFRTNAYGGESRLGDGLAAKAFLVAAGAFVGVFAISLGIGGGLLLAPLLAYYLGFDSKRLIPVSLFFIIFSSVSGFISLARHGYADYHAGLVVGVASLIGVRIGIWILSKIDAKRHKYALIAMYCVVLTLMIRRVIGV